MRKLIFNSLTVVLVLSMVLVGCKPKAAPTATPVPTKPPATATPVPPTPTKPPVVEYEDEWGVVKVEKGDTVKVGVAFGLSGAGIDVLGLDELRGVELALKDKPEIKGFEIELAVEDEMCNAEGGQTVANKFVANPEIVGVVGHMCSSSCIPGSKTYEQHGYTMISPSCTGISLTVPDADATEIFNRVCWSDKIQGPAAAEFVKDVLGVNKVATIHDGSPYAEQLALKFAEAFEELGGEVVAREAVNVGDTDMRPVLTRVKGGDPELIYSPIFPAEAGYLAAQRPDVGMEDVIFMGADGIKAESFIDAAGDWAEGVYASAGDFAEAGPALPAFLAAYKAEYGEDPIAPFHAHAYDAYMVLVNAIEKVAEVDADGNLFVGRKKLRDAVRATKDYQGLSGKIACDANGDCGSGSVSFSMVKDAEWAAAEAPAPVKLVVGQVTDMGGIDDKSFNQTAWKGFQDAMAQLGVEAKFLESQQQADYAKNIQQFLSEDLDLIVTVGFLLGVDTAIAAVANPDTNFAIVDYAYPDCWPGATPGKDCGSDKELPNVLGLTFATDEASFLAGYLAAGMTKTGKVGTFGGIKIPTVTIFMVGFEAGVKYYNQQHGTSVEVLGWDTASDEGLFTGNFESTDDGRRFGESLMDEGADILLPVAGPVGLGTAAACQERGTMLIGVDTDWYVSAPEFKEIYLTSILKNMDVAVFDAIKAVADGTFKGGVYVGTLPNNGVGIAPYHEFDAAVPADLKAEVEAVKADLIAKRITVAGVLAGEAAVTLGTEENPIIWSFVPSGEMERVAAGAASVADLVYKETGLVIETNVATEYAGVIEAMCADPPKAHMASLATFSYVLAADKGCAEAELVSVRYGSPTYNGQLIARADSGITSVADLAGKTFCRPDPLSTSGWIIPMLTMRASGVDTDTDLAEVVDAGSHDAVAAAVYNGDCDAGATYVDARTRIEADYPDVMEKVVVIALTEDIPNDGVQYESSFPRALRDKINAALLKIAETDEGKEALNTAYQWAGLIEVRDSFYDPFRQVLSASGLNIEDLLE